MKFGLYCMANFTHTFLLGAVDLIRNVLRTHTKNKELRDIVGPIIGILIPLEELEEMASKMVLQMREALDVNIYFLCA